jgi:hypothetical protein
MDRREYDATGRLVPWHLSKTFAGRRHLVRLAKGLEAIRNDLAEIGNLPYCHHVDVRRAVRHLEAARVLVLHGAPFGQCECVGSRYGCEKCEGQRWLSVDRMPYPKINEPKRS